MNKKTQKVKYPLPINPSSIYNVVTRIYSQEDVIEALGLNVRKGDHANIYCDGINKVRVEIYRRD